MSRYNVDTSGRFPIKAWTKGVQVAKTTTWKFVALAIRLYEQEPGEAEASARFGLYVRRWVRWSNAGLAERSMKQKVRINALPKRYDLRPLFIGQAPQDILSIGSGIAQVVEDRN